MTHVCCPEALYSQFFRLTLREKPEDIRIRAKVEEKLQERKANSERRRAERMKLASENTDCGANSK